MSARYYQRWREKIYRLNLRRKRLRQDNPFADNENNRKAILQLWPPQPTRNDDPSRNWENARIFGQPRGGGWNPMLIGNWEKLWMAYCHLWNKITAGLPLQISQKKKG